MNGSVLGTIIGQRGLGMQVHNTLKVVSQRDRVVKAAFSRLDFIIQGIDYRQWDEMLPLYMTLVRPHLEYIVQF